MGRAAGDAAWRAAAVPCGANDRHTQRPGQATVPVGTARGAALSGAPHAMAVNETVIAITRTPAPRAPAASTRSVPRQRTESVVPSAAVEADAMGPRGIGTVGSLSTEASQNLPSTRGTRTAVRADAVLQAPEAGLPVLFVEVDNCTESPEVLAAKFEKYRTYFRLKTKTPQGLEVPVWRTRYAATGRDGHPPVAVVFNPGTRTGPEALKNRMNTVLQLSRQVWSGTYQWHGAYGPGEERDEYYDHADAIPVLFTTLDRLQTNGPHEAVWRRCGHGQFETLPDALANPQDHDAWALLSGSAQPGARVLRGVRSGLDLEQRCALRCFLAVRRMQNASVFPTPGADPRHPAMACEGFLAHW
ncbi:replication-relaxation family protein [Streptomyces sp. NPDC060006]|uniref:replication-relaxation family protein n=1 Tax=unclassified Streptomyces TaxID=2593676 RepID=UPI003688B1D2